MQIEAGKYYRTRDGRKVGPMETWQCGEWHAPKMPSLLAGGLWNGDGSPRYSGASDSPQLVAEWVDEPAIVAVIRDGKPSPAIRPVVHPSTEAATAEARRLARQNPGQEFAVFQRVAGVVAEVTLKDVA